MKPRWRTRPKHEKGRPFPFREGDRVRLRRDVERYPHFTAPKGAVGEVSDVQCQTEWSTCELVCVRMDERVPGAEDWDNEVCWQDEWVDDVLADLERE